MPPAAGGIIYVHLLFTMESIQGALRLSSPITPIL